jgi:prolipoprotein diacylglyceryl transferase
MTTPFLWNIDPEIFRLGVFAPRWYGLCFATCLMVSFLIMRYFFRKEGKSEESLNSMFVYTFVGTVVGARLGHCLFYDPDIYIWQPWRILFVWEGGLASHGGTLGVFIASWLGVRKWRKELSFVWYADRVAIAAPAGVGFIRLGNFFNSEIIGKPTSLPWAVVFQRVDSLPRHPAMLYEAFSYWLLFALMVVWYRLKGTTIAPGRMIGAMFVWIFGLRFLIEFVKENQSTFEDTMWINMGQLLSIPIVLVGVYFMCGGWLKMFPEKKT